MRHVELLAPHAEPIVVVVGSRLRSRASDFNVLEYYIADLGVLKRPVTFRVSGMITGPEEFVERIAPHQGHLVEVFGPDGNDPKGLVRRLNKEDERERDASSLIDSHALWLWVLESDLYRTEATIDPEMVQIAKELEVPILAFMPESRGYEIVEL